MDGIHSGLFFSNFDYGYGNELVPYIKSEMKTTLIFICVAIVTIWAVPMAIKLLKNYEEVRFYRSFFTMLMVCGAVVAYFSIAIWDNTALTMFLMTTDIVGGTIACVIGELLDDKYQMEQERKARFRRRREIRKYMRERGM